jgi:formate dehydrogenase assembly factor FdhD
MVVQCPLLVRASVHRGILTMVITPKNLEYYVIGFLKVLNLQNCCEIIVKRPMYT